MPKPTENQNSAPDAPADKKIRTWLNLDAEIEQGLRTTAENDRRPLNSQAEYLMEYALDELYPGWRGQLQQGEAR